MPKLIWFNWINRQKIVVFLGSLILCLGVLYPWYQLPPESLDAFNINLAWTNLGRLFAAILTLLSFTAIFHFKHNSLTRLFFWIGLTITLLFPYCVTTWSPKVSFVATAYSEQSEAVTKHIERNFSEIQAQWKQGILLDTISPPISTFDFAIHDSRFFQLSSWDRFVQAGFGYKNGFLTFIGRGWVFTVVGLTTSLIGFYLGIDQRKLDALIIDVRRFLPGAILLLAILVSSMIWANVINYNLDTQFAKGEYPKVILGSKFLASWYPPFIGDELFQERLAKAEFYGGETDPVLMNFVKGLERYQVGDLTDAENYFRNALNINSDQFLVRGYLAVTLLNQGVNSFNGSGKLGDRRPSSAADFFERVLEIFPDHVEALYNLMIARSVNGEFDKSAKVAQQIIKGNKYFQQPTIALLGQAYLHQTWADYANLDIDKTWQNYRKSIDSTKWKMPLEVGNE
jgi:tetratricopeptide (TPR) repeat protein